MAFRSKSTATLKFAKILEECDLASVALGKVYSNGYDLSARLASWANLFCSSVEAAATSLNDAIPNVHVAVQIKLKAVADNLIKIAGNLQPFLMEEPEVIQEKLSDATQEIKKEVRCFIDFAKETDNLLENQLRKATDEIMFAICKLKYEALHFNCEWKNLGAEIRRSLALVTQTSAKITSDNPTVESELHHLFQMALTIGARMLDQLQSWMAINPKAEEVKIFSATVSEALNAFHLMSINKSNAVACKNLIQMMYERAVKDILAMLELSDLGRGAEELIRSSMLDGITAAQWYSDYIEMAYKV